MTHKANQQIMEGMKPPRPHIEPAEGGEWGHNWSNPEDTRWGRLCGAAHTAQLLKMKCSWAYARRTISCNNPVDPRAWKYDL